MHSNRHAYLIMAHHRPDLLQRLIDALDDERNDIFIHVDKKSDMKLDDISASKSGLFFIPRINVNWGGYSQIDCTMRLLSAATEKEEYAYYHLMTGASYPLKNQDDIHEFFDRHQGEEFIKVDSLDFAGRVRYYWVFNEGEPIKYTNPKAVIRSLIGHAQKLLGVNMFKKYHLDTCKGLAYWSITHEFASYVLNNKELIEQMMKHSLCGDEMFVHILGYNSRFRDRFYRDEEGTFTSLRFSTWGLEDERKIPGHNFELRDVPDILDSKALFALKFEGPEGMEIIDIINRERDILKKEG